MLVSRRGGDVVMSHLPSKNQQIFHPLHAQQTFSLEEELFTLASIVESSDDAIFSKTLDGIVLSWNKGAERIYGYTADEMIGQPISIVVPPDRPDEFGELMGYLKVGETIERLETERIRKDGQRIM